MRILHLSTRLIVGGSQENTVLSCRGAADAGHTVALGYGPIYGPEGSLLGMVAGDSRIERFEIPDLVRELSPTRDVRCHGQLRKLIATWKPDVVHTHSSKAGILGRSAARTERVRAIVHTVHGLPFHSYESWWRNGVYVRAERWAARRCDAIVSVADAMTRQALASGVGRAEQYRTIRSGMEVGPFLAEPTQRSAVRARLGFDDSTIVLGTLSRLAQHKGHDDLIEALAPRLRSSARGSLALLWIGDGWWRERLTARLKDLGIADRVVLTGLVVPSEIPALLSAVDLVVHPSYREGLPRAVVQGLLSGKAAIAYDVDGAREVCIPEETGLLVRPGDIGALRQGIERLTANAHEREAMGRRGRELVREAYDWRLMSRELLALYQELLDSGARRPPGRVA